MMPARGDEGIYLIIEYLYEVLDIISALLFCCIA